MLSLPGLAWLTPSAILPFTSARRLRCRRTDEDRGLLPATPLLIVQPVDARLRDTDLSRLPVHHLVLDSEATVVGLTVPVPPARLLFELNLAGFSALVLTSSETLRVWLLEPDFSLPAPYIGPAAPHLMALMEGQL
jgi:hypothetical protein